MSLYTLFQHQEKTVQYGLNHPYCIFALQMGTGKTLAALDLFSRLENKKLLIVCPSYLVLTWGSEIKKFFGDRYRFEIFRKNKELYYPFDSDIAIISYNLVQEAPYLFEWANVVVCDEAQNLKTMEAKRTQFIHKEIYENSIENLYLLSGTPIKNRVIEYYSLIALCNYNPRLKNPTPFIQKYPEAISFADHFSFKEEFELEKFSHAKKRMVRIKVARWDGLRNEEELKQHLKDIYIRFKTEDVLDLPEIVYKDIVVSDHYHEDLYSGFIEFQKRGTMPRAKAIAALNKVKYTVEYVKGLLEETDSVVIFSDHVDAVKEIAKHFKVHPITGEVSTLKRQELSQRFQSGKDKIIVATIGSFSTGHTLTRAHNLVFNDFSWVPGDNLQAIYRIHRIGQKNRSTIHNILGSPQDKHILKTLSLKSEVIERVT